MKYAYIASQRTHYPIGFMCRVLEVSTSGFFAWQARERAPQSDADTPLRAAIIQVHEESRRRYGRRRLAHALRAQGMRILPSSYGVIMTRMPCAHRACASTPNVCIE
ncbi:MAG TPA: IS3 family transposase [Acidiferrobacter sp.]|nr:IS3 family transposase [Acidiferrobacter sp.]